MSKKTIGRYGPARGGVRVFEDPDRQLVTVFWRVGGRRRKKSYTLTREGRKEARAFAKALVDEWSHRGRRPAPTTRAVWKVYIDNQQHLRPRTVALYSERWAKWELYVGADFIAEQADGLTMAGFVSALRQIGHAVNQIAEHVKQVKIVYAWARAQKVIAINDLAGFRFRIGKDEQRNAPAEYREDEYEAILAELDPRSSRTWRAHAALLFMGTQGSRVTATLNLRYSDLKGDRVRWARGTDKTGREWRQPLRYAALAAIETARYWARHDRYVGDYVFYSARRIGPYSVQGLWAALRGAEDAAEVPHRDLRAFHGLRRKVTGDILAEFGGDLKLAMDFTGHKDLRSFQKYLKERDDQLAAAVAAMEDRERSPETGTRVTPELSTSAASRSYQRATGRIRTDDREHAEGRKPRRKAVGVAASTRESRPAAPKKRPNQHPKPAPKRHPTWGGR